MIGRYIELDSLIKARIVSLNLSGALAAVAGGFAAKALAELHTDRQTLAHTIPGGKLYAGDIVGAGSAMTGASMFGVGVSWFALILVYFEQRGKVSNRLRWTTECLLGFSCFSLLAALIATTIICVGRSAVPFAPSIPSATIVKLIEAMGRSLKYRDTKTYIAMIVGWFCFFFLTLDLVLLIAAGLRYRRLARERRASATSGAEPSTPEFHEDKKVGFETDHV
ncbi:uncharacterized protein EHS24_003138 [Apiotrichum porosum]|uniref:MARVEL domain-containing protein n=1 Tax=Apiotrichum porosum TaxID=105984 RepID=A0A427XFF4_9TREE|nr:uncharacterized protein EHS24_003138 [Apiotrichum porosum]RSH77578.1 hypothetical protein EHS24_003138 [Apiotrichum porosum]